MESQAEGRTGGGGDDEGNQQDSARKHSACPRGGTFSGQEEYSGTGVLISVWGAVTQQCHGVAAFSCFSAVPLEVT